MIKLIIVDDEPLALENFAELIDWESYGYAMEGCAENGEKALKLIEKVHPDIVFTDIQMPVMDGLRLCQEVYRKYPEMQIVLLTAYKDFEYARQALAYGVREYMLKNQIEKQEVLKLLSRLSDDITKRQAEQAVSEICMLGKSLKSVVLERGRRRTCICVHVSARTPYFYQYYDQRTPLVQPEQKVLAELLADGCELAISPVQRIDENSICFFMIDPKNDILDFNMLQEELYFYLRRMDEYFQEAHQTKIFTLFSIGNTASEGLQHGYEEMHQFAVFAPFFKRSMICDYGTLKGRYRNENTDHTLLRERIHEIESAVRRCDVDKVKEQLLALQATCSIPVYHLEKFNYVCGHLLEQLENWFEACGMASLKEYIIKQPEISSIYVMEDIWRWIVKEYHRIIDIYHHQGKVVLISNRKIEQAIEYIHKNYASHLTAQSVGEEVGLSEVYFSSLFKKELDTTFGNYLTSYRMNIAKHMLVDSDMKIYEIAEKTGYSTPQYFSQIFQRVYGMTPLDYKKYGGSDEE